MHCRGFHVHTEKLWQKAMTWLEGRRWLVEVVTGLLEVMGTPGTVVGEESDVICVGHMGHRDKNGSKFHLAVRGRAAGEVENNRLNCVTLSLVNGHGESQIEGEDVGNLSCGNRGENVASGAGEFGAVTFLQRRAAWTQ